MSLIQGLLAAPLFLSLNFYTIFHPLTDTCTHPLSPLCLFDPSTYSSLTWPLLLVTLLLTLSYLLRPLSTTSIIHTTTPFTHLLLDLTLPLLFTILSSLTLTHTHSLTTTQAAALLMALASRTVYYKASVGRQEEREVRQGAGQAVKEVIGRHWESRD
jgi:hypothetical protein